MSSTPWAAASSERRAFLQRRVTQFGLIAGCISLIAIAFRAGSALAYGYFAEEFDLSMFWHVVSALLMLGIWFLARRGQPSFAYLYWVEGVGLVGAGAAYALMATDIEPLSAPGLIAAFATSYILLAHAIFVPTTARHTAVLGVAMALPLLAAVFWVYWHADPWLFKREGVNLDEVTPMAMASNRTAFIAMWWTCTTVFCTATSWVIYGLRKQVDSIRQLGQYTLEAKLGQGGMGVVYRASHAMLRRPTAVKLLLTEHNSPASMARFEREVQLTAGLTHANTVTVFDYGRTPEGVFYYVMEYLDGPTLGEVVEIDGEQEPGRVVSILRQVASSLQEAHSIGLIHRDIKPSNVILTRRGGFPDVAKVLDFGLVKDLESESDQSLTHLGEIQGTPQYMAPESISDPDRVDARSDLYALAALGYFLLTAEHLFSGATIIEVCSHHLQTIPPPASAHSDQEIPKALDAFLLRCLAKTPAERPATAGAFIDGLDHTGVAPWTSDRAEQWWAKYKEQIQGREAALMSADAQTIAVDLEDRAVPARNL